MQQVNWDKQVEWEMLRRAAGLLDLLYEPENFAEAAGKVYIVAQYLQIIEEGRGGEA